MPLRKIRNPRSFDTCRSCKHSYISHTDFNNQNCLCQYVIDGACQCLEYLPEDNLEFLEYKYGRKLGTKISD